MIGKLFRLRARSKLMSERNDPTNPHFPLVDDEGNPLEASEAGEASGDMAQAVGERLDTENAELRSQLLRMRAEFENFRR